MTYAMLGPYLADLRSDLNFNMKWSNPDLSFLGQDSGDRGRPLKKLCVDRATPPNMPSKYLIVVLYTEWHNTVLHLINDRCRQVICTRKKFDQQKIY